MMASYQKRGKTWQYTISRMVNGKSKPIRKGGFRTKKEAQVVAMEVEAELRKGIVPHLRLEPFDEYFKSWVKTYKTDVSRSTLDRYKNSHDTIVNHFGQTPIQEINKRSYQSFINEYGESHARASTTKLNMHIRECVRDAIDEGIIKIDFTRKVTLTGKAGKKKIDKYLDYEDSQKLLNHLYNNLNKTITYYMLLLGLVSGLRFSELAGLTRNDFNFKDNTIHINKTWGYTKRMVQGYNVTKNEQSNRIIAIDDVTMDLFKSLFQNTTDNIKKLVFYSPKSKYHVISNAVANKVLSNVLDNLNIKHISVHGLRHTHGSICLYEGSSINYVSERLGHADIQTTMGIYIHVLKELKQRDDNKTTNAFKRMYV